MNTEKKEIWQKLSILKNEIESKHLRNIFESEPDRFDKYSIRFNDILLDYSKNIINDDILNLLLNLAEKSSLKENIESMFTGEKINFTENRAVLHTALRNLSGEKVFFEGQDVMPDIENELNNSLNFAENVRKGNHKGFTGKTITDVVNIGIGGSHLGPDMVCTALSSYSGLAKVHFVSNVDPSDITQKLKNLNPETTLFLIASKTFSTQETMANANKAKQWFLSHTNTDSETISYHFAALSTNISVCKEFGISDKNIFGFWDWVGGRYSLWSVIGLSIAISIGSENFRKLLNGAYSMDIHFRNTPFEKNIPVILAVLGIWYDNFWGAGTHSIIPYDQYLVKFSEFLQQLDMESNGKRITKSGNDVNYSTGPVIWGTIGTNSQHSFFQLIHQGTQMIPVDFIAGIENHSGDSEQHSILLSNFFAQTEALMKGKNEIEVRDELEKSGMNEDEIQKLLPHKVFPGNKPTNTILYKLLTPEVLGSLIAMYEHKVFVQGIIWELNSFDQWGVELGKQLAKGILADINKNEKVTNHDSSTNGLLNYYLNNKGK
jgi:glucose-6-phosphate isomerase